ncbi:MAG: UDP-N-acetylmuramoyl-tripeptide--D-alanyl-D-alanine ligase [Saprospiraceae bacterium]|nr:UDP-N-acetylmuramoyl-tripeptide--D-alanyl-D-alanine ligase [Saprospiraceae bacterium]
MPYSESYTRYLEQDRKIFTDSRQVIPGGIFVALKGPHFNGNQFAAETLSKGAAYAIVDEDIPAVPGIIRVQNCLQELQAMAAFNRKINAARIISITGSNGKTTTKELTERIFSLKYNTIATHGNLNNHIGLPLTLLRITEETEVAIVEMGANKPGDIDELCRIADPDQGLITSIGKAHLEGFGSYENIIDTKLELFRYLQQKKGRCYFNLNDQEIRKKFSNEENQLSYGDENLNPMYAGKLLRELPDIWMEFKGMRIHSVLMGRYNYDNILSACALAFANDIALEQIKAGIESYVPGNMRSEWIEINGCKILLDAYNANPSSMQQSLKSFSEMDHPEKWLVLGEMAELGAYSEQEHKDLMKLAALGDYRKILFIGKAYESVATDDRIHFFDDREACKKWLDDHWPAASMMLIKGSRSSKLEQLIR